MPLRPLALVTAAFLSAPLPVAAQPAPVANPALGPTLNYVGPLPPAAITLVQERLRSAGDFIGRVDGIWSVESKAALERFQQRNGLQTTGTINPATAATLRLTPSDLLGEPASITAVAPAPAAGPTPPASSAATPASVVFSPAAIRNVQTALRSLGLYFALVDGTWGPFTQAALVRFQTTRGLPPDGQVTPATLQALGLDPADPGAAPR